MVDFIHYETTPLILFGLGVLWALSSYARRRD